MSVEATVPDPAAEGAPAAGGPRTVECATPGHTREAGYRVVRAGVVPGTAEDSTKRRQRHRCVSPDGDRHHFTLELAVATAEVKSKGGRPRKHSMTCPKPAHGDGVVTFRGEVQEKAPEGGKTITPARDARGTRLKWRCVRPNGDKHQFTTLTGGDDRVVTSLDPMPACPTHGLAGKVRRHGFTSTKRKGGEQIPGSIARQRYRCVPTTAGAAPHCFTAPLPRAKVEARVEFCPACEDQLTVHQGRLSGARGTRLSLSNIVTSTRDLAFGASYSQVGRDIIVRRSGLDPQRHTHSAAGGTLSASLPETRTEDWTARQSRAAWRLAADLVEQYSPIIWEDTQKAILAREDVQRRINDDLLTADPEARLVAPIVYVCDEKPVSVPLRRRDGRRQTKTWYVLTVAELVWHDAADGSPLPTSEGRLRLARAMPSKSAAAWSLVLADLTRPDYLVCDKTDGLLAAVRTRWGSKVGVLASTWHIYQNLRDALWEYPTAKTTYHDRTTLLPVLSKHLGQLRRDDAPSLDEDGWARWWDELEAFVVLLGIPATTISRRRTLHQQRIITTYRHIVRQPQLPASNASVEAKIRDELAAFTSSRRAIHFRNVTRTCAALDLRVAASQGAFNDPDGVRELLRRDNEAYNGWAPRPRQIDDPQPLADETAPSGTALADPSAITGPDAATAPVRDEPAADPETPAATRRRPPSTVYASLFNPFLVHALARQPKKQLTTP